MYTLDTQILFGREKIIFTIDFPAHASNKKKSPGSSEASASAGAQQILIVEEKDER
jgi:hypothetical protein